VTAAIGRRTGGLGPTTATTGDRGGVGKYCGQGEPSGDCDRSRHNRVASVMKEAASDGLPTAMTEVADERWPVKLDSGARYSVAGTDWMMRGEQLREAPPVDVVECIGGFVLDAIGAWAFQMRNVFGQLVGIKACIFDGCTEEFLVGVDFLAKHRANVDSTVTKCGTSSRTGW
jgi:hypothetical protein